MKILLYWHKELPQVCMLHSHIHRTIYEKLSSAFVDEIKEVYEQRVQELAPNIRYCAYNIGDESAMDDLRQMRIQTGGKEDALSSRLDVSTVW